MISEQEMARVTAACRASARPIAPANAALPGFARNRGNLLTHARTARFYPALAPRGSSGLADVPPQGNYQSTSDGGYASTAVNVGNLSFTTLLVDLTTDRAILCRERINGGNRTYATNWSAFYYFDDQPMIERTGRCPVSLWEYPPETLLDWRQHLLKIPSGKAAPASAGAIQQPVAPIAGLKSFGGHCNGFTLAGREYMEPGRCPEGVSLFLPAAGDRGKPRLTIKTPARGAPTLVFQLDQAVQGYINNDIVTFDASPISGLPFSWSAYDRLQCVFVKSPSDAAGAAGSRHQPSATINCSFQGNPLRDADKLIFGFFADQADIPAFRAAFIAAHDQLNPGRPFVSPAPDMRTPQPN